MIDLDRLAEFVAAHVPKVKVTVRDGEWVGFGVSHWDVPDVRVTASGVVRPNLVITTAADRQLLRAILDGIDAQEAGE